MINSALPLVDLHRHLDGNIKTHTIWTLAKKHGIALPVDSLDALRPYCEIEGKTSDLMAFLSKLDFGIGMLVNEDAVYDVAYQNIRDAKDENLDYVELRFSPMYMSSAHQLSMASIVEAIIAGVNDGQADFGVKVGLIGIMSRTYGTEVCRRELDALLHYRDYLCGIDLAGDEKNFPATWFTDHFRLVRDAGLNITVHAGEADGPQSIWDAIEILGASRIGHGIAAQQDSKLIDYLAKHKIGLEVCPTSNYQTGTVINTAKHPIKQFVEAGIEVTLNTDDPGVSAIDIQHEYNIARNEIGLTTAQLNTIQLNGLAQSFLSEQDKNAIRRQYEQHQS